MPRVSGLHFPACPALRAGSLSGVVVAAAAGRRRRGAGVDYSPHSSAGPAGPGTVRPRGAVPAGAGCRDAGVAAAGRVRARAGGGRPPPPSSPSPRLGPAGGCREPSPAAARPGPPVPTGGAAKVCPCALSFVAERGSRAWRFPGARQCSGSGDTPLPRGGEGPGRVFPPRGSRGHTHPWGRAAGWWGAARWGRARR